MTRMRQLDPAAGVKPLDFGANGITGSVDQDGCIIAINSYHAEYGYVTLTTAAPFPEDKRYDPAAVRAYRRGLATLEGFGFRFPNHKILWREAWLMEDAIPQIRLFFANGVRAEITTFVPNGHQVVVQCWDFQTERDGDGLEISAVWSGDMGLQRCAYTQLTEGGPLEMPDATTGVRFDAEKAVYFLTNEHLHRVVAIGGDIFDSSQVSRDEMRFERRIVVPCRLMVMIGSGTNEDEAAKHIELKASLDDVLDATLEQWGRRWQGWSAEDESRLELAVKRGLRYGFEMGIPAGYGMCILTDHMLLPLSWNRDAYYVAKALMLWREEMAEVVKRHLIWMFEIAERTAGLWGRAYLANGKIKDKGFQLDQQVFPLLEFADYVLRTKDTALTERLHAAVNAVLGQLMRRKATDEWLFPTDETPADDPIAMPYHFSSHVLMWHMLWHMFRELGRLNLAFDYDLAELAAGIQQAVQRHFVAEFEGKSVYAYATDGHGKHHFYHDANDFPLAFAPVWGFCGADDDVWRNTVDFAFSEANTGGFYGGHLGSVHTPAPWALGDIQELLVARLMGDSEWEQRVTEQLSRVMQWDGGLPEAYGLETGRVVSRHWFAWPNAVLACIELEGLGR